MRSRRAVSRRSALRSQRRHKAHLRAGLWARLLAVLSITLAVAVATPAAYSQPSEPVPGPSAAPAPAGPEPVTVSLHAGVLSLVTRGEKREYAAARVTLNAPLPDGWTVFGRADLTGNQDGGSLDYSDPSSFRSLEGAAGFRRKVGPLELAAVGGATWSVEGEDGAPTDPRLYTAIAGVRVPILDGGYVYAAAGLHQPVGGAALLLSAVIPASGQASTFVDFALPFEATALQRKTWTLKIGGAVRLKSFELH